MKIQKLLVEELWGKYTFSINFNEQISILIGKNGSGKSTILNIIDALLSKYRKDNKYKFKKIALNLDNNTHRVIEEKGDKVKEVKNKEFDIESILRINYKEAYHIKSASITSNYPRYYTIIRS